MKYLERMNALRQDHDLTQEQVAKVLGVAQTTYSQYELGKRQIPIDTLSNSANFITCLPIICSD